MILRLLCVALAAISFALVAPAPPAEAGADCQVTIAFRFSRFAQARMKIMQRCRELVRIGRISGPCPDDKSAALIAKARAKLRGAIDKRCGGTDELCGGGDDVDLAVIGWDVGQCPGFHAASCTNAIADCGDVADCLTCVGEAAADEAVGLFYDSFDPDPVTHDVARCQGSIGRSVARYFTAVAETMQICEQRDLGTAGSQPCPDLLKAVPHMARAEAKLTDRICATCGSSADGCGGDNIPVSWIGFPSSCPAVTVPGGSACGAPVHNLFELIDCVRCVTDFHTACIDPLSVPALKTYPGSCTAP